MPGFGNPFVGLLMIVYYILYTVQVLMAYGTAYRKTKAGGDNGAALFGWMIVYMLAAALPGLGIGLWWKNRDLDSTACVPTVGGSGRLSDLIRMKDNGEITQEEFDRRKRELTYR